MNNCAEGSYFKDTGGYCRNSVMLESKSTLQVVKELKVLPMAMYFACAPKLIHKIPAQNTMVVFRTVYPSRLPTFSHLLQSVLQDGFIALCLIAAKGACFHKRVCF